MAGLLVAGCLIVAQLACVRAPVPEAAPQPAGQEASDASEDPRNPLQGSPLATYGVAWVGEGDVLAVRQIAGGGALALEELPPDARDIRLTGNSSLLGSSLWVEVRTPAGTVGWVNAANLTELLPGSTICDDARARQLVDDLVQAVDTRDMAALAGLVSDRRGLNVRLSPGAPTVTVAQADVARLLSDTPVLDWGSASESSSETVVGSFADAVLPRLAGLARPDRQIACNELLHGQTARPPVMPMEFRNLQFFSVFVPSQASSSGLDWQTWAVLIEVVGGEPRIGALARFQGEM
jgi:hypothetical protein